MKKKRKIATKNIMEEFILTWGTKNTNIDQN